MKAMLAVGLLFVAMNSSAQQSGSESESNSRKGRWFLSWDYFTVGNAADGMKDDAQKLAQAFSNLGYSSDDSFYNNDGYGGRIGYLREINSHVAAGVSLGYLKGPDLREVFSTNNFGNGGLGWAVVSNDASSTFTRLLLETQVGTGKPTDDNLQFLVSGGLGVAFGNLTGTATCTGPICAHPATSGSASWSGFTYEIAPTVAWKGIMTGYRLAVFPTFEGTNQLSKMAWTSSGFFLAYAY